MTSVVGRMPSPIDDCRRASPVLLQRAVIKGEPVNSTAAENCCAICREYESSSSTPAATYMKWERKDNSFLEKYACKRAGIPYKSLYTQCVVFSEHDRFGRHQILASLRSRTTVISPLRTRWKFSVTRNEKTIFMFRLIVVVNLTYSRIKCTSRWL